MMNPDRILIIGVFLLLISATSCSLMRTRFELRSEPSGAQVSTLSGEKLGSTPLVLSPEQLARVSSNQRAAFRIEAPGYAPGTYFFEVHGEDLHQVKLLKLDDDFYQKRLLRDFVPETNNLVRSMLRAQAFVLARRFDDAARAIDEIQKRYPNVAASYALLANMEMARGNTRQARKHLETAYSLDPSDPLIARALGRTVKSRGGEP